MNGIVLGAIGLALVLLVVATRPVLARIGTGYALARPRNAALIMIGLMVAGSVVVSAGIVGDSAGETYLDSLLSRTTYGDGLVHSSTTRNLVAQADVEQMLASPDLQGIVADSSTGIRAELPIESQVGGMGRDDAVVWGVDPAAHAPLREARLLEGDLPTGSSDWASDEIVLTRGLAADLGAGIGDTLTLSVLHEEDGPGVLPPRPDLEWERYDGSFVFATQNPSNGSYMHSPADEYEFPFTMVNDTLEAVVYHGWACNPCPDATVLQLYHEGDLYREERIVEQGNFTLAEPPPGDWTLQVHSPLAADMEFSTIIQQWYQDPEWVRPSEKPVLIPLTVRAIISDRGADIHSERGVAFVPLRTLQEGYDAPGRVNAAFVTASDGVDMDRFHSSLNRGLRWDSATVSVPMRGAEDVLEEIRFKTQVFFLASSMFTFIAGLLLIVVIMALLAEERKTTIATMRALGASRSAVTRMHIVEGALYAGGAAVLAVLAGTLLVVGLSGPLSQMYPELETFRLHLSPSTVLASMGIAFALTVATIAIAAHRATRLDPVAAMRGEEQTGQGTFSTNLLLAGLVTGTGILLLSMGLLGNAFLLLIGLPVLVTGVVLVVRRTYNTSGITVFAFLVVLLWSAWRVASIDLDEFALSQWLVLPAGAILIGLSAAGVFVHARWIHDAFVAVTSRVRGLGPVVDTALSHLRGRPGRAFLTIGMLATVLVVITTMGTLASSYGATGYHETGGFAVFADTRFDLEDPQEHLGENPPTSGIDPFALTSRWAYTPWSEDYSLSKATETGGRVRLDAYGMTDRSIVAPTPNFIETARFSEATLAPEYDTLQDALRAVMQDPGLAVLSDRLGHWTSNEQGENEHVPVQVGDRIETGPNQENTAELRVIALVHRMDGTAAILHPDAVDQQAQSDGYRAAGTRIWAQPAGGVSDEELANAFESAFRPTGMLATLASDPNLAWSEVERALMLVFFIFLSLGLVIGIVALGLVTVRNTMVRRREIGVIRAMGGMPRQVLFVFAVEALYVVLAAIAIGLVGGLWVVASMIRSEESMAFRDGTLFAVDPVLLGTIYGITLFAGIATAVASSWHAARVAPAEAVRYVE